MLKNFPTATISKDIYRSRKYSSIQQSQNQSFLEHQENDYNMSKNNKILANSIQIDRTRQKSVSIENNLQNENMAKFQTLRVSPLFKKKLNDGLNISQDYE